ncbi:hypothetical protein AAF134_10250 [Synechococcus lacustris Tous-12m]
MSATVDRPWLLGLLLPVLMANHPVLLVASEALQRRLLQRELMLLAEVGLRRPSGRASIHPMNLGYGWLAQLN